MLEIFGQNEMNFNEMTWEQEKKRISLFFFFISFEMQAIGIFWV